MATAFSADDMVEILRDTIQSLVRKDGPDLNARQLAVLLICYLDEETGHTVRGLASALKIAKPAVTRALDRLTGLELAERKQDVNDRRSVLVQRTNKGTSFMRDLRASIASSITAREKQAVTNKNAKHQTLQTSSEEGA